MSRRPDNLKVAVVCRMVEWSIVATLAPNLANRYPLWCLMWPYWVFPARMGQMEREASDLSQRVAAELRAAQARLRFTWTAIEQATGIPNRTMSRMIKGKVDIPVAKLMLICEAAGLSVTDIIEDATRHMPYQLHDLLTNPTATASMSPDASVAPDNVTNIQQMDWNRYEGKKAADVDDEVQENPET